MLRLEPAVVTRVWEDGDVTRHPESHFLDMTVNGESLRALASPLTDLVTELNRPWLPGVTAAVDRLLGRRPTDHLAADRVALLVCPVDGDPGCGHLTAALHVGDTQVAWSEFRWEDGISPAEPIEHLGEVMTFDRTQYEAAFAGARQRVAALPYDELEHRGRRFLWPWQWGWKLP